MLMQTSLIEIFIKAIVDAHTVDREIPVHFAQFVPVETFCETTQCIITIRILTSGTVHTNLI